ncbi:MAG: hypothetical protein AAFN12_19050, partial [Cyanobacteria bacterium J06560_2]
SDLRLDNQLERKARRLSRRRRSPERVNAGGVAEVVFRNADPELLARARDRIAQSKVPAPTEEPRQRREVYQRYASKLGDRSPQECDQLVARQLMSKLLSGRKGQELTQDELIRVGRVLLEGPVVQELEQSQGEAASRAYVGKLLTQARPIVEQHQQAKLAKEKSKDQGMSL